jgi:hypothetical protein
MNSRRPSRVWSARTKFTLFPRRGRRLSRDQVQLPGKEGCQLNLKRDREVIERSKKERQEKISKENSDRQLFSQ